MENFNVSQTFGEIVANARRKTMVSHSDLANACKISTFELQKIEKNEWIPGEAVILTTLAKTLNIPLETLLAAANRKSIDECREIAENTKEDITDPLPVISLKDLSERLGISEDSALKLCAELFMDWANGVKH